MKPNELKILGVLAKHGVKSADELAQELKSDLGGVVSALEKMHEEKIVHLDKKEETTFELSQEGRNYAEKGLPETRLLKALAGKEAELEAAVKKAGLSQEEKQVALQWALRKKIVALKKAAEKTLLFPAAGAEKQDGHEHALQQILGGKSADEKIAEELRQRKLVSEKTRKIVLAKITEAGKKALQHPTEAGEISQLTPQMLKTGEWKNKKFLEYELNTVFAPVQVARKHPYKEFLQRIKEKLVGLGFREVRGSLAEIEFWNMDALYMPQDHPARQIHDVFFIKHPDKKAHARGAAHSGHHAGEIAPPEIFEQVFASHKHGGRTGSRGWRYEMSREISSRVILRSHDTGISARELAKKLSPPDRVFFIAHVFRPDEIDWKHFIEFNQLGGYVADENTSFRDLLGTLKTFAEEVFQAESVKFVPSYFPFTEPSVELYAKIPGRGWAEVGGAGLFRPEMCSALGVDYPVIAWGLGIDRLAMLSIGINDIRELHSHNLQFLQGK